MTSGDGNSEFCFGGRTLCLVTGASRGIGREISLQLAPRLGPNSKMILHARQPQNLDSILAQIRPTLSPHSDVQVWACDLEACDRTQLEGLPTLLDGIKESNGDFDRALLIHNAGTVGDVSKKAGDFQDPTQLQSYMNINVTSMILVNNLFMNKMKYLVNKEGALGIVNITSLYAQIGAPAHSLYCTSKHAREGFLKSLAVEYPKVRVLNYSPGVVKTDLIENVLTTTWDQGTRDYISKEENCVPVQKTVAKMLEILEKNTFKSGSHVDFYD